MEKTLLHGNRRGFELDAYVVMNDHIHALVRLPAEEALERVMHSWKSFSAHQLQREWGRQGAIWQREYFDRIVRSEMEWFEKMEYIVGNPAKRWPDVRAYRWVYPKEFARDSGTEAGATT